MYLPASRISLHSNDAPLVCRPAAQIRGDVFQCKRKEFTFQSAADLIDERCPDLRRDPLLGICLTDISRDRCHILQRIHPSEPFQRARDSLTCFLDQELRIAVGPQKLG